ncbi:MAG: hypothetical protein JWM88_1491 [Verrucomicrobia bacterium]|nr:hypothetical protein [Verrucomicrobiota bacterium]
MNKFLLLALLSLVKIAAAHAAAETLLVPPGGEVPAGRTLTLGIYLNNPSSSAFEFKVPAEMKAALASASEQRELPVVAVGRAPGDTILVAPMSFAKFEIAVVIPDTVEGTVSLRLTELHTNAVMFAVRPAQIVQSTPRAVEAAEAAADKRGDDVDLMTDWETMRRHVSSYEPNYFAVGNRGGLNARFQFSFKYLLVGPNTNEPQWWRSLYLGYTQTSLWDLSAPSKPFYDTSYKPTLFYYLESAKFKPSWLSRFGVQMGMQHESNGKGTTDSRSLNTVYATPTAVWAVNGNWQLTFAPKFIAYLNKDENGDVARYRGNIEYLLTFGKDKGVQVSALLRKGNGTGYGSGEVNVTWPLRQVPIMPNVGGYLQLQYFNGWGESLLDYNRRRDDQVRVGYMLTR